MLASVAAVYDGTKFILDENVKLSAGQRVIITVTEEFVDTKAITVKKITNNKKAAFRRLEDWRKKNEDFFGADYDWKKEVVEGINEKYGLVD